MFYDFIMDNCITERIRNVKYTAPVLLSRFGIPTISYGTPTHQFRPTLNLYSQNVVYSSPTPGNLIKAWNQLILDDLTRTTLPFDK